MTQPNLPNAPWSWQREVREKDIHVPGAGAAGMIVLLIALSMLFAASMLGYLYIRFVRFGGEPWPPPGFPPLPRTLWLSTFIILAASVAIQTALHAVRRDRQVLLRRALAATLGLGLLFLLLQSLNWWEIFRQLDTPALREGPYVNFFFILTALHAAHVIGGLVPLTILLPRARRGGYSVNFHPGIRYTTLYWHFLDAVWLLLFTSLYLI